MNEKKAYNSLLEKEKYQWILFDADETLFSFDSFRGLQLMFSQFDIIFTADDYKKYQLKNKSLWVEYQNKEISALQLQCQRFSHWAEKLGKSPQDLNNLFLHAMADVCLPLEGAVSLLNALRGKTKLGIITNGFKALQEVRLERNGLKEHFDLLVISEEVGVAKPHINIFEHALSKMGNPERSQVLMVGDNPDSDILGGINIGFNTCWLNVNKKPVPENIIPHYEVSSLADLEELLLGKKTNE